MVFPAILHEFVWIKLGRFFKQKNRGKGREIRQKFGKIIRNRGHQFEPSQGPEFRNESGSLNHGLLAGSAGEFLLYPNRDPPPRLKFLAAEQILRS